MKGRGEVRGDRCRSGGRGAVTEGPSIRTSSGPEGIIVTVSLNGDGPAPRATSGANRIAGHRPTRYALMMRRARANASRRASGRQQLPAVLAGDCSTCDGLGVVNDDRVRCPICMGSGER